MGNHRSPDTPPRRLVAAARWADQLPDPWRWLLGAAACVLFAAATAKGIVTDLPLAHAQPTQHQSTARAVPPTTRATLTPEPAVIPSIGVLPPETVTETQTRTVTATRTVVPRPSIVTETRTATVTSVATQTVTETATATVTVTETQQAPALTVPEGTP